MPSILMLTGAPTEKNRSEALLLAANCNNGVMIIWVTSINLLRSPIAASHVGYD
jgi:hypothetical protein